MLWVISSLLRMVSQTSQNELVHNVFLCLKDILIVSVNFCLNNGLLHVYLVIAEQGSRSFFIHLCTSRSYSYVIR